MIAIIQKDGKKLFINHRHVQYLMEREEGQFYVQLRDNSWLIVSWADAEKIMEKINSNREKIDARFRQCADV